MPAVLRASLVRLAASLGLALSLTGAAVVTAYAVPDRFVAVGGSTMHAVDMTAERMTSARGAISVQRPHATSPRQIVHRDWDSAQRAANRPAAVESFAGLRGLDYNPASSSGAAGPTRIMQVVNSLYAIYDRAGRMLNAPAYLNELVGGSVFNAVVSAQVIWDPDTERFYYSANITNSWDESLVAVGYSKTASPNTADISANDFCQYAINYGRTAETDFPLLGDSKDLLIIGVNIYNGDETFRGADLLTVDKPAPGETCAHELPVSKFEDVAGADGHDAFTLAPANQIDGSPTGHVLARSSVPTASLFSEYTVDFDPATRAVSLSDALPVRVPTYSVPRDAPQPDTDRTLDTLDGRLTQVVSAIDPSRGNAVALWTQHTVLGGAGAEVRWYEIDAGTGAVLQRGTVTSSRRYVFNAAISPDRLANGAVRAFGDSMVLNVNMSSATTAPSIKVVSKRGHAAQTDPVTVVTSLGPHLNFSCDGPNDSRNCEWGDYASASPDPAAPATGMTGRVFGTSPYTRDGRKVPRHANWLTRNFFSSP